jgi:hypothetical protein
MIFIEDPFFFWKSLCFSFAAGKGLMAPGKNDIIEDMPPGTCKVLPNRGFQNSCLPDME